MPPPLEAHYSAARHPPAPPPRAHAQSTPPLCPVAPGSPIKIINHFFTVAWFQNITPPAIKTLALTTKNEGQLCSVFLKVKTTISQQQKNAKTLIV